MKSAFFGLVLLCAMNASAKAEYVTVEVCNGGETGTLCQKVTYKVRPSIPTAPASQEVCTGNDVRPCDNVNGHVPQIIEKLNETLEKAGFEAPVDNSWEVHGG